MKAATEIRAATIAYSMAVAPDLQLHSESGARIAITPGARSRSGIFIKPTMLHGEAANMPPKN